VVEKQGAEESRPSRQKHASEAIGIPATGDLSLAEAGFVIPSTGLLGFRMNGGVAKKRKKMQTRVICGEVPEEESMPACRPSHRPQSSSPRRARGFVLLGPAEITAQPSMASFLTSKNRLSQHGEGLRVKCRNTSRGLRHLVPWPSYFATVFN
jgi:hypothetical protein